MTVVLAGALAAALVAVPHFLPQSRLAPTSGIALWVGALLLRAVISLTLMLAVVVLVPATQLFDALTHWCLHTALPLLTTHLGVDGHRLGGAAVSFPALLLGASALSMALGLWRSARALRRWLRRGSIGQGPAKSVIVAGSDVVVAAAGLRAPRVVVSAGALVRLDDDELAAGLEHEWGHVRRRHRLISVTGEACYALGRMLPGGRRALAMLHLHLERDADDYAVRRTGDRLALASAICKAADAAPPAPRGGGPAFAGLAERGVAPRLRRLMAASGTAESRPGTALARGLAVLMLTAALSVAATAPTIASAGAVNLDRLADRGANCA